jgi:predicted CxxxxCH...CXXCH cytochrome family protein
MTIPRAAAGGIAMTSSRWITSALVALSVVACGKARTVKEAAAGGTCTACHGGTDNASGAPPRDTHAGTATTLASVGAHSTHVAAGIDCSSCHVKPATISSPGHMDGRVTLTWGSLATASGTLSPAFDEASGTCASVYCHGSFFGGNAANAPSWTKVGQGGGACGTCHLVPPPLSTGHPQRTGCGDCHGGYTSTSVNPATHVNGKVDVLALACTTCHGDPGRTETALNPQLPAAPPADTSGNTDASAHGVGAHQAHLQGGPLRAPLACTECHAVPASLAGHPNGVTNLTWGSLAQAEQAQPSYAGGTCSSTYCHGATLGAGGSNHAPSWTGGSSQASCGTCHALPPPAPHPQNTSCGSCHEGYTISTANPAFHVNGQRDVVGLTCTTCHGDSTRGSTSLNPQLAAAPPVDTSGSSATSSPGVGAHQAHLQQGPWRDPLACTDCHAVPTSPTHANGVTNFQWSTLATGGATTTPVYASGSCSATYCHGATLGAGGSNLSPSWTGGAGEATCGSCHTIPPPAASGHPQTTNCGGCHPGFSSTSVNRTTHVDGQVEVSFTCASCHGDANRADTTLNPRLSAAPPVDTHGNSDPSVPGVGAHQAHLTDGPLRSAIACTECHTVPADVADHPTGTLVLSWGALAWKQGTTEPSYSGGSCAATYCHGATLNRGGTNHTPSWTGGASQVTCGTCHGAPPPTPHPQTTACGNCHGQGYGPSSVNPATHVNGALDLLALTCTSCHGNPARANTTQNPQLSAAPPVDTAGNTDTSSPGVGAHQAHLTDGALRASLSCTDCHAVPTSTAHYDGTVQFAWSALATDGGNTTPAFDGTTCSNTYCHGSSLNRGGTNHTPAWTGGGSQVACGTCHAAPPPAPHSQKTTCGDCHGEGYSATTVNPVTHVNGQLDIGAMTCTSCHGDSSQTATPGSPRWAAPPVDTYGLTDSARVGKHAIHLDGSALSAPVACTQCHTVPQDFTGHPNGVTDLPFTGALATGAITATINTDPRFSGFSTTTPSYAGGTCSSTYCHGSYSGTFTYQIPYTDPPEYNAYAYAGKAAAPGWTGTADCGSCHDVPPSGTNTWHSGFHGGGNDCSVCHPDATGTSAANAAITDPSLHINGKIELNDLKSSCFGCH